KLSPFCDPLFREWIDFEQRLHTCRTAEIENNDARHGGQEIHWVDLPEFPFIRALLQHLGHTPVDRSKIFARDAQHLRAALGSHPQPLCLYHARKSRIRRDIVEITSQILEQFRAWLQIA